MFSMNLDENLCLQFGHTQYTMCGVVHSLVMCISDWLYTVLSHLQALILSTWEALKAKPLKVLNLICVHYPKPLSHALQVQNTVIN